MVHAEGIVAATAAQHVKSGPAFEAIVACIGAGKQEDIVARAAVEVVAARAAHNNVGSSAADNGVVALSAVDLGNADQFGT